MELRDKARRIKISEIPIISLAVGVCVCILGGRGKSFWFSVFSCHIFGCGAVVMSVWSRSFGRVTPSGLTFVGLDRYRTIFPLLGVSIEYSL